MFASYSVSLILLSLTGAVLCASIKGGFNGTKGGGWTPPKDWDWSVTPGRLIPVSEATDDLPTPGYRMSQLQQRIPAYHDHQPFPIAVNTNGSTSEEKVVVIGPNKQLVENNNELSTIQHHETTEQSFDQSTLKEQKLTSVLAEQELILLQDDLRTYQLESASFNKSSMADKREQIPVVEEEMVKVELPEICSISGIGCRDPKPVPQLTETSQQNEVPSHPAVTMQSEIVREIEDNQSSVTGNLEEQATESISTMSQDTVEENTTNRDQVALHTFQVDQQGHSIHHPSYHSQTHTQRSNKEPSNSSIITTTRLSNESDTSQELVTLIVPHFNVSVPTVVHSVLSSVSEHIGTNETEIPSMTTDSTHISADRTYTDSQQVLQETEPQQQEQQVQQFQFDHQSQLPKEEQKSHQVDEQSLLQIANSWSSSGDSNSTTQNVKRRVDFGENSNRTKEATTEEVRVKEDVAKEEVVSIDQQDEPHKVPHVIEQSSNSTESPSIGDKIESYWKAATGYVSKALHL